MPGSIPPTSQLDWLNSTTAMIVLFWSRAARDLLKSFGWGIAALHRLDAATKLPFLAARSIASLGNPGGGELSSRALHGAAPGRAPPTPGVVAPSQVYVGGGTKPPISVASSRANA